jgi:hypothetical protein
LDNIEVTFKKDKETKEIFALLQGIGLTPTKQPIILTRLYRGNKEIDFDKVKKLSQEKESKIVLLGGQNKKNQLDIIDDILQNEYDYKVVDITYNFNFQ